ncbi:MAG: hypothetical protein H0S79_25855 [Anaerolineaceae bacterium]|nr:hypothetical protein [Anaerolineaceae bacterium]
MKNRRLFAFSIVVILTLSLAACGGSSSSSSNTKNAAIEYMQSVYTDEATGDIDIKDTKDITDLFEYDDDIGTAYCIAFEDIDGNAYYTFVFKYEGEWKTEGVTRIGIASCDFIESN